MLKRLRYKFILTNTLYVGIVLILVFLLISVFTSKSSVSGLEQTLARSASEKEIPSSVDLASSSPAYMFDNTPHMVVVVNAETGEITEKINRGAHLEEEICKKAADFALKSEDAEGIYEPDLCYARVRLSDTEIAVAFASTKPIEERQLQLIKLLALIGGCAIALVIAVSFPVAKLALLTTENAWEQQKRFIADASHALKTPLTVILANIAILRSGAMKEDAEASHWLTSTEEEAHGMHDLIRDMLVLTQSDLNVRTTEFTLVNLSNLLTGLILQFEAIAFDKNINFQTDIQNGIELRGNEKALSQMMTAIIENAFKYEKNGGCVTVKLEKQVRKTVFSVHNASTYISPDQRQRIFDRFCRLKNADTRQQEGHGLGLSIARSVADAHQASIDVESGKQTGTIFKVSFRHIL